MESSNVTAGEKKLDWDDIFNVFGDDFDRFDFPADVYRVTAGFGGEALLIVGSEKTALLDCGMAYCGSRMVEKLARRLAENGREKLDYIILSHSHYDHMGALPYVRRRFPEAMVCGSRHCREILRRPNARKLIKELGEAARELYDPESNVEIPVDGLAVDVILEDGDVVSLGNGYLVALETKGHTDCSMSFALEPAGILFTSESTGMLETSEYVHTPILKDYSDAMESLKKCREYGAKYICLPHFGMLPQYFNERYWEMFEAACREKLGFVGDMVSRSLTEDQMTDEYIKRYWNPALEKVQPVEAYVINARAIIKAMMKALE